MKDEEKHGQGTLTYDDGSIYEGVFVKGKKEGKGKLIYSDGVVYTGDFLNDKIETSYFYVNTILEMSLSLKNVVINTHKNLDSIFNMQD